MEIKPDSRLEDAVTEFKKSILDIRPVKWLFQKPARLIWLCYTLGFILFLTVYLGIAKDFGLWPFS